MTSFFTSQLLKWHADHPRPLPWDDDPRDPYHIWISEIIMQQTRIEQGASYYKKFIHRFPTVQSLSDASTNEVLRYWQGLGYYSRARNMHKASRHIVKYLNCVFPESYDALLQLPGVGPYTAAAIASFGYGLPHPVVDGNVKRLVARFTGITTSMNAHGMHDHVLSITSSFMKGTDPAEFNQAIMNFGALVCKPKGVLCSVCPLSVKCYAFKHGMVDELPVRPIKKISRERYFHFIVLHYRGKVLIQRRESKDIWQGLYTPPLIERKSSRSPSGDQLFSMTENVTGQVKQQFIESSSVIRQQLSHQTIIGRFHHVRLLSAPAKLNSTYVWVSKKTIGSYGKPRMIVEMMEQLFEED